MVVSVSFITRAQIEFKEADMFISFLWCSKGKRKRDEELEIEDKVGETTLTLGFGGITVELFQTGAVTKRKN